MDDVACCPEYEGGLRGEGGLELIQLVRLLYTRLEKVN